MDGGVLFPAADLHLVAAVSGLLIKAADGSAQEDLFAVDDLQGVRDVVEEILG